MVPVPFNFFDEHLLECLEIRLLAKQTQTTIGPIQHIVSIPPMIDLARRGIAGFYQNPHLVNQ